MRNTKKCIAMMLSTALLVLAALPAMTVQAQAKSGDLWDGLTYSSQTIQNSTGRNVDTYVVNVRTKGTTLSIAAGVPNDRAPLQKGVRQTVKGQAQAARNNGKNVLAAVNGDFFNSGNVIAPQGITIRNGEQLSPYKSGDHIYFFGILDDGTAVIGNEADYKRLRSRLKQAVGGGDCLLKNGKAPYAYGGKDPQPRTAVGIKEDGSVLLVVADGRTSSSAGLSLADLAAYMKLLGAVDALNLDGGGSSTMVVKSRNTRRFETQNNPSGGSERAVGNTILVIDSTPLNWLDNLPDGLVWIATLANWLEKGAYYLFFGWLWDIFKQ